MLAKKQDAELFAAWSEYIRDDQARAAFRSIIGLAACLRNVDCEICWKGQIRDFRFFDDAGEQPLSFITNKHWLLFYFRPPAVRSNVYSKAKLSELFETFVEKPAGEWTVKLQNIDDVERLAGYLGWLE